MLKRTLFEQVKNHLDQKEITFIAGPRQAGKTTLMLALKEFLGRNGEKTIFLNLDIEKDKQFFNSQSELIKKIQLEIGAQKGFVFIDEIQRKENAGIFLKGIYDMNLPYKLIVSGSGSVELKENIHESLAGRKIIFNLNTLSFDEFVNFKTEYRYEKNLLDFFHLEKQQTKELLSEYLNFGGYPRVALEESLEGKNRMINEIYQSYLEKDIAYLLGIQKTEALTNLVKIVASQIGNLINYSEIASTLGLSQETVKKYLWYLEKTFIINKVTPYFKRVKREITKAPEFYFYDFGLRNYATGEFGNLQYQTQGFSFENLVFNILKETLVNTASKIHFWRSKDGAEVDFIVDRGKEIVALEVKFKELKKPELTRSLKNFLVKYQPRNVYVVNLLYKEDVAFGQTKIHFIPFYEIKTTLTIK